MAKLNKAEKFVVYQIESGKTRNQVREAIFEKLGTWNFPPEYENALVEFYPTSDDEPILGVDYLDNYICDLCGNCHETCFCGDELLLEELDNEIDSIEEALDGLGHSAEAEQAVLGNKSTQHEPCVFCRETPCGCAVIELPKLPDPGGQSWEDMIDYMRKDIASGMGYTKVQMAARELVELDGRDFDEEAALHAKSKGVILAREPGVVLYQTDVDILSGSINRIVRHDPDSDAKVKALYLKWTKERLMCNNCRSTWRHNQNSTGYCESCGSADVKLAAQMR